MARWATRSVLGLLALAFAAPGVVADDILETVGITDCSEPGAAIKIQKVHIQYNANTRKMSFDLQGTSGVAQNVKAYLSVDAYGRQVYENSFDPCDKLNYVDQLCPVPQGTFAANGSLPVSDQYASMIPSIAFQVPDISAFASLKLIAGDSAAVVACVESQVTNGKTTHSSAVSYIAAGLAGLALVVSAVSAAGVAIGGGGSAAGATATIHPSFSDFIGAMQGVATTGMMSVTYPPIVRSFTQNFAFSVGLIPWSRLQISIDDFRGATGGNLTRSSYEVLKNTTLVFGDSSTRDGSLGKRAVEGLVEGLVELVRRQVDTSVSSPGTAGGDNDLIATTKKAAANLQAFSESLMIPESNTFMTILLVIAIVIAVIVVSILLFKVILELWALFANFPKRFHGLRNDYWGVMARTITHLIVLLYGIWVLFSIYQFSNGDSWAAIALAGTTLAGFTGLIAYFTFRIFSTATRLKFEQGSAAGLFEDKTLWRKYSLFYESYRQSRWWLFIPNIIYLILRGVIIAGLNGQGLAQTVALLAVESVMLIVMCVTRPFERRSGNIINIGILVVRVISVAILLVFVDQLNSNETTKSVSGVVLISVQSALTGVLGLLIVWNAIIAMCKENPHRKRRKEMEKLRGHDDPLTSLDARNSLLGPASVRESYHDMASAAKNPMRSHSPVAIPEQFGGARESLMAHETPLVVENRDEFGYGGRRY